MKFLFSVFFLIVFVSFLSSTIINIPADQPTIQAGIDVAVDGDTVLVQPGTYVENINFNSKNIVVASHFLTTQDTSYISQTIIDGNQNGSVVTFDNGEDSTAVLMGFTITNGLGNGYPEYSGGGVTCRNYSNPSIDNVIITGSSADIGGGIYIVNSSPKIEECTITLNQVFQFGAGIYLIGGTPIIKNNEISFNSIPYGPGDGIYCSPSDSIEISGNIFIDNGILFWGGSFNNICIKDNIFENFISGSDKKAIEISGTSTSTKTVYIIDNYFSNFMLSGISSVIRLGGTGEALNTAIIERNCFVDLGCPAVSLGGTSDAVINGYINNNNFLDCIPSSYNNSIIRVGGTGNATIYGDIINNSFINCGTGMVDESVIDLGGTGYVTVYTSIIGNLILDSSTGIKVDGISGSQLNGILLNNTIVNNTKGIEKGSNVNQLQIINTILWNNDDDLLNIAESEIQFSNISDGDYSGINENISEPPLFVGTGEHPFSIQDLSPCVNSGTPDTTGLNLPEYDLAGNTRIFGGRIDMGAYENQNVVVNADEYLIPNEPILYQNYPNPFNPSGAGRSPTTTISFSIPEESKIELTIYNIKGQRVRSLANNVFIKGNHSVIWDGNDDSGNLVSSGIYLYKLIINGKTEAVKKCLLLK